jgi:AsmA protein
MKRPKQSMRRYSRLLAVACFLTVLLAAPLIISDRFDRIALQSGAVFAASSNSYSLSAPVRLMTGPTIEIESGTLSMPPNRTGLARGGQMIAMLITGSGPQMTLEDATFTADFSTREPTFSQEQPVGEIAPLVKALQSMQFSDLDVRDSTVRIKMSDASVVELHDVNASISGRPNGAIQVSGSFEFHGEKIEFETALGASLDAQGMSRPISASFSGTPLAATLDGSLMLGESPQLLSPQAELTSTDLRATARWLGVNWPSGHGFGPFRAKGQLEWVNRTVAFQNAAIELDENDASGTLSINFAGPRPAVEGTLGLKTLDLTQYLKHAEAAENRSSLLSSIREASGLAFPLIEAIDADFRISSDSVVLPATTIGRSAATVSLRSGKMLADIAELEFEDGTRGIGQIRIDQSGRDPSYGMQAKFESPDVGHAIQAVFGHPTVQGRGAVIIDLTAAGDSGESLLRSLDGKLSVTLAEGGRIGIDVNVLTAPESEALPDTAWQEVSSSAISVDKLDARFVVANGILRAQSAEAVSGARALKADGAISLIERRLDMELAVGDVAPSVEASEAASQVKLQPRSIINMHGPWSSPAIRNEPAENSPKPEGPAPG